MLHRITPYVSSAFPPISVAARTADDAGVSLAIHLLGTPPASTDGAIPGFVAYYVIDAGDGVIASVSVFHPSTVTGAGSDSDV